MEYLKWKKAGLEKLEASLKEATRTWKELQKSMGPGTVKRGFHKLRSRMEEELESLKNYLSTTKADVERFLQRQKKTFTLTRRKQRVRRKEKDSDPAGPKA